MSLNKGAYLLSNESQTIYFPETACGQSRIAVEIKLLKFGKEEFKGASETL